MQVKIVCGDGYADIEEKVNALLLNLPEEPRNIQYDFDRMIAVVEYDNVRKGAICCECRFWDDGDSHDALIGLCQRRGGRKRFSDKGCNLYEDIRD